MKREELFNGRDKTPFSQERQRSEYIELVNRKPWWFHPTHIQIFKGNTIPPKPNLVVSGKTL